MKLSGARGDQYVKTPDKAHCGVLIFGQDAMRVTLKREALIANLAGENAEADMRLARISGAELRKDPAMLQDALKAVGFFPGHRVVFVEDATDAHAPLITEALTIWEEGDASLVVTAGSLRATSKLRKAFESLGNAVAIAVYDDPPSPQSLMATLAEHGVKDLSAAAREAVIEIGMGVEPGDFLQFAQKLALFHLNEDGEVSQEDVDAVAPQTREAGVDDLIAAVGDGASEQVGTLLARLASQGTNATSISIALGRHFRVLHSAASASGGADAALSRARPPVFGPRKDRMLRQIKGWGQDRLEQALDIILETERILRSSKPYPQMAVLERALIRLSMLRPRAR
ncbi:MAG: DNA polymerase III subunit delta [Pseudomonadota bacterium]